MASVFGKGDIHKRNRLIQWLQGLVRATYIRETEAYSLASVFGKGDIHKRNRGLFTGFRVW